ncbi:hypothetical protein [uncultured Paraglaciecola sp.]|uniref:hypothetical protein n=1 Tax=uncultured Paraglaciecola sp. TaxID=1765024 RepID=UPI0030D8C95A|tara:strand:- start:7519 stop:8097 length:579 start_codon:yes stop_codon:yes gene_type:complete
MTKQNQQSDDALEQHYLKRKSQHLAPASIKRHVLAKQHNNQNTAYIFRRISYVAVAASTLLLISLVLLQRTAPVLSDYNYQVVQLHTLDIEPESVSARINNRYAEHYKNYLAQKNTYAAHHKSKAVLHLVDAGWQLKNCDNEVLQLSNELIAALSNIQQIDTQINSGDAVEIVFDESGIILGITRSGNHLRC